MNNNNLLSLEQELKLTIYKQKLSKLNSEQLQVHVKFVLKQMMIKENLIKYFIKNSMT